MKHKTSIATIALVIIGSLVLPFINFDSKQNKPEPQRIEEQPSVYTVTNSIHSGGTTNSIDRAPNGQSDQNLNWFIQGSNYIWDDWKIK